MKTRRLRMMAVLCLVTVVLVAVLSACTQPTPEAPEASAQPASEASAQPASEASAQPAPEASAQSPSEEVIKFVINAPISQSTSPGMCMTEFKKKVEEASGGSVEVVLYFNSSLFTPTEAIESIKAGMADMQASYSSRGDPALMVLNNFVTMPFLGFTSSEMATIIYRELYEKFPELTEEFQGLTPWGMACWRDCSYISSTKKQIQSRDDLQGVKMLSSGLEVEWFKRMGAVPVDVPFPERYVATEKGLIEADTSAWGAIVSYGTLELLNYHTKIPTILTSSASCSIINPDSLNKLPPDIQKLLQDLDPWWSETLNQGEKDVDEMMIKQAEELGHTFAELSPEETELWKEVALPMHEEWITEKPEYEQAKRALYDEVQQLIKEYSGE